MRVTRAKAFIAFAAIASPSLQCVELTPLTPLTRNPIAPLASGAALLDAHVTGSSEALRLALSGASLRLAEVAAVPAQLRARFEAAAGDASQQELLLAARDASPEATRCLCDGVELARGFLMDAAPSLDVAQRRYLDAGDLLLRGHRAFQVYRRFLLRAASPPRRRLPPIPGAWVAKGPWTEKVLPAIVGARPT